MRTCYPLKGDSSYTGLAFSTSVGEVASWVQPLGTVSYALDLLPTQAVKAHYGIRTCHFRIASVRTVIYARVTYITETTTITQLESNTPIQTTFPSTQRIEDETTLTQTKSSNGEMTTLAQPSITDPSGFNISQINTSLSVTINPIRPILYSVPPLSFDADRFVRVNSLDLSPNISSYCSSYYSSIFSVQLQTQKTQKPLSSTPLVISGWFTKSHPQTKEMLLYWPDTDYPALVTPCCGACTLSLSGVGVHYWPTPAIPGQTKIVNHGNSTL